MDTVTSAHDKRKHAAEFMYNNNIICFIIIVIAFITAQFWFEYFDQFFRELLSVEQLSSTQVAIVAIGFTIVFIVINFMIFGMPVAASFTY